VALRYHNVYGPGMPRDTPYSGVAAIFRSSLERDEPPRVFEDGGQMRDFVHVEDVARANLAALTSVGRGGPVAWRPTTWPRALRCPSSTWRAWSAAEGVASRWWTGEWRAGDVRHVVASPALARAELGFEAVVGPEEGLAAFATAPLRE